MLHNLIAPHQSAGDLHRPPWAVVVFIYMRKHPQQPNVISYALSLQLYDISLQASTHMHVECIIIQFTECTHYAS